MSVDAISFSAHADFPQTSEFIAALQPPHVVFVHGEATNMQRLRDALAAQVRPALASALLPKLLLSSLARQIHHLLVSMKFACAGTFLQLFFCLHSASLKANELCGVRSCTKQLCSVRLMFLLRVPGCQPGPFAAACCAMRSKNLKDSHLYLLLQAKALGQERQFYMPRVTQAVRILHKPQRLAKVRTAAQCSLA